MEVRFPTKLPWLIRFVKPAPTRAISSKTASPTQRFSRKGGIFTVLIDDIGGKLIDGLKFKDDNFPLKRERKHKSQLYFTVSFSL
ncbi:unnamed protein product [Linum trigynum]|uniref:Uncharacterized protein n=1 Tax=Linum trigynum TaxID=586398 RepID=A0AAV2F1M1_9ROSI